jgi:hypothetical protein
MSGRQQVGVFAHPSCLAGGPFLAAIGDPGPLWLDTGLGQRQECSRSRPTEQ